MFIFYVCPNNFFIVVLCGCWLVPKHVAQIAQPAVHMAASHPEGFLLYVDSTNTSTEFTARKLHLLATSDRGFLFALGRLVLPPHHRLTLWLLGLFSFLLFFHPFSLQTQNNSKSLSHRYTLLVAFAVTGDDCCQGPRLDTE